MKEANRRLVGASVVVLGLLVAAVLVFSRVEQRGATAAPPIAPAPTAEVDSAALVSAPMLDTPPESSARVAQAPVGALDASPSSDADCLVRGRVVDQDRRALVDVPVRLYGYKGWAEGHDAPRFAGKYDLRGWEVRTDDAGAFRFAVPVPTVERTQFGIEPDPFHDSVRRTLGGDEADALPPLHAGDNDLGKFLLVATGAIRGRVTAETGEPLAEAELRIALDPVSTLEREGLSDASGSYEIAHVKPGSYGVAVDREGYLSAFAKPFVVEANRATEGVDFILKAAPTLRGHVVDEKGRGLAGARLWGWPSSSGRGAGGESAADGGFVISLPQDEPYTMEVELTGYDTLGLDDRETHYAPGTSDLRFVLHRSPDARTRFVVVDSATEAPIERFGLEIERDQGSRAKRHGSTDYRANPRPESHPEGELEVDARPGVDRYTVCAPGFVRQSGDVEHAVDGDPRQMIRMVAGGTLTGRVLGTEGPESGATVRLQLGRMEMEEEEKDGASVFRPDLDTAFQTATDADGRFRFDNLAPDTYQLLARGANGRCAKRSPLEVLAHGDVDVGELVLRAGSAIHGRVLVPSGRSAAGLTVYLAPWQLDVKCTTDAEGRFAFEGLLAGSHSLLLDELPGVILSTELAVTLRAGEVREVELDARDKGTCTVTLTLELGGTAAVGRAVSLVPVDSKLAVELGVTDATGTIRSSAPACGRARIVLMLADRARLVHPEPLDGLVLDAEVTAVRHFEVGTLRIALPPALVLPERGWGTLTLTSDTDAPPIVRRVSFPPGSSSIDFALEGGELRCENIVAGEYELTLSIQDASAAPLRIPIENGYRTEQPSLYRATSRAAIRAGTTTRVELP